MSTAHCSLLTEQAKGSVRCLIDPYLGHGCGYLGPPRGPHHSHHPALPGGEESRVPLGHHLSTTTVGLILDTGRFPGATWATLGQQGLTQSSQTMLFSEGGTPK